MLHLIWCQQKLVAKLIRLYFLGWEHRPNGLVWEDDKWNFAGSSQWADRVITGVRFESLASNNRLKFLEQLEEKYLCRNTNSKFAARFFPHSCLLYLLLGTYAMFHLSKSKMEKNVTGTWEISSPLQSIKVTKCYAAYVQRKTATTPHIKKTKNPPYNCTLEVSGCQHEAVQQQPDSCSFLTPIKGRGKYSHGWWCNP